VKDPACRGVLHRFALLMRQRGVMLFEGGAHAILQGSLHQ
jgi:hypothetical protein